MRTSRNRTIAAVAAVLLAGGLLAGCGKHGTGMSPNSPSNNAAADGSGSLGEAGATATATATSGGGATTPPAPSYPMDIAEYAKAAVKAWVDKDATRVDQLETAGGTLHTMLGCNNCYDVNFYLSTCPNQGALVLCIFFNNVGDVLSLKGDPSLIGKPHAILGTGSSIEQVSFPSDNKAYAQLAMGAWLSRNDNRLKLLTNSMTSAQVDALGGNHNALWNYDHSEGAAGSIYYVWKDPSGHTMSMRFTNGTPAPTTGAAAQHRITQVIYMP